MEETLCPLCQERKKAKIWTETQTGKYPFTYRQCCSCGFVFLDPRPDEEEILQYYAQDYYGEGSHKFRSCFEGFRLFFARKRMRRTQKFFPCPGKALDIGCGQGTFLQLLKEEGWDCHGTELTKESAFRASQKGIPVSVGEVQEGQFTPHFFDLISFWQVLEHLPDPMKVLKALRPFLKKEGIIAISTPNIESLQAKVSTRRWFHLDPPRHLCLFSPETLERMMRSLGFSLVEIRHFSMEQNPYGWLQSLMNILADSNNLLYMNLKNNPSLTRQRLPRLGQVKMFLLAAGLSPFCLFLSLTMAMFECGDTIEAYFRLEEA